ncbi:MAG: hypothetical protein Q8S12_17250 [Hydrogenophaga sp.]|uniref:hypothetical protein n=1 Tax=Hydrogenophaga sp. TaxID=1904254 RepID=UPI002732B1E6|nr:hypothetical protein [Hydrogenophaga sp.]MDP3628333.1 hypothetical protein [Hydrogenophaga sp.]
MLKWTARWLLALVALPPLAQAQGLPLKTATGGDFGIQVFGHTFDADRDGAFDMWLDSRKLGLAGSITQLLENDWHVSAEARSAMGATSFSSAARGSNSGSSETLTEFRLTVGRDFTAGQHLLAPYTGLGYRTVLSQLKGYTNAGYISPTRDGNLVYLPIGVIHRYSLGSDARLATTLEYDHLLQGTQKTSYTDIAGYVSDLKVTQKKGKGARLSVAYETAHWSTSVFYHHWAIEESEVGTYANATTVFSATEARNISRELGIQIRYRFGQ